MIQHLQVAEVALAFVAGLGTTEVISVVAAWFTTKVKSDVATVEAEVNKEVAKL